MCKKHSQAACPFCGGIIEGWVDQCPNCLSLINEFNDEEIIGEDIDESFA